VAGIDCRALGGGASAAGQGAGDGGGWLDAGGVRYQLTVCSQWNCTHLPPRLPPPYMTLYCLYHLRWCDTDCLRISDLIIYPSLPSSRYVLDCSLVVTWALLNGGREAIPGLLRQARVGRRQRTAVCAYAGREQCIRVH
jgi:hypothetical protein